MDAPSVPTPSGGSIDPAKWAGLLEGATRSGDWQIVHSTDGRFSHSSTGGAPEITGKQLTIDNIAEISNGVWARASHEDRGRIFRSLNLLSAKETAPGRCLVDFKNLTINFVDKPDRIGHEEPGRFVGKVDQGNGYVFEGTSAVFKDEDEGESVLMPMEGTFYKDGEIVMQGTFDERGALKEGRLYQNGFIYVGNFENQKLNGQGQILKGEKAILEGLFAEGCIKTGKWTNEAGTAFEGSFDSQGRLDGEVSITIRDGPTFGNVFVKGRPRFGPHSESFVDKANTLLLNLPESPVAALYESRDTLPQAVVAGLKGNISDEARVLHAQFPEAVDVTAQAFAREGQVKSLLAQASERPMLGVKTAAEQTGLLNLMQHRHNYSDYSAKIVSMDKEKEFVDGVVSDIGQLGVAASDRVVTLSNGDRLFCFPGGWRGHAIAYGIRKRGSDYFFEIYNAGDRGGDQNRLHGDLFFPYEGKVYSKTVVSIQTSKGAVQNPAFIRSLIAAKQSPTGAAIYGSIHEYFISGGRGEFSVSKEEVLLTKLQAFLLANPGLDPKVKGYLEKLAVNYMDLDPSFHQLQSYGSCTESNPTLPEKFMAPKSTRTALKQSAITSYISKLSRTISPSEPHAPHIPSAITQLTLEKGKLARKLEPGSGAFAPDPIPDGMPAEALDMANQMIKELAPPTGIG